MYGAGVHMIEGTLLGSLEDSNLTITHGSSPEHESVGGIANETTLSVMWRPIWPKNPPPNERANGFSNYVARLSCFFAEQNERTMAKKSNGSCSIDNRSATTPSRVLLMRMRSRRGGVVHGLSNDMTPSLSSVITGVISCEGYLNGQESTRYITIALHFLPRFYFSLPVAPPTMADAYVEVTHEKIRATAARLNSELSEVDLKTLGKRFAFYWESSPTNNEVTAWRRARGRTALKKVHDLDPHLFLAVLCGVPPSECAKTKFDPVIAFLEQINDYAAYKFTLHTSTRAALESHTGEDPGTYHTKPEYLKLIEALSPRQTTSTREEGRLP
jgi:hypothetical protein